MTAAYTNHSPLVERAPDGLAALFRPDPGVSLGPVAMREVETLVAGGYAVEVHGEDRFRPTFLAANPLCTIRDARGALVAIRPGGDADQAVSLAYEDWYRRPGGRP